MCLFSVGPSSRFLPANILSETSLPDRTTSPTEAAGFTHTHA